MERERAEYDSTVPYPHPCGPTPDAGLRGPFNGPGIAAEGLRSPAGDLRVLIHSTPPLTREL